MEGFVEKVKKRFKNNLPLINLQKRKLK